MTRRLRSLAVLGILAGGALALIASTQTWLEVTIGDAGIQPLAVPGASAVPLLAPLSLAAMALALALSIVGTALRYLFAILAVAIGGSLAAASWRIAAEQPVDAVGSAVTEVTGLAGAETIGRLVTSMTATVWPAVTILASALIVAGGVFTLATARRWPGAGRRYRTEVDRSGAPENRAGKTGSEDAVSRAPDSRPHDAIDSWDDLSRGDDPTADR